MALILNSLKSVAIHYNGKVPSEKAGPDATLKITSLSVILNTVFETAIYLIFYSQTARIVSYLTFNFG